jgi:hypothetical protein
MRRRACATRDPWRAAEAHSVTGGPIEVDRGPPVRTRRALPQMAQTGGPRAWNAAGAATRSATKATG